MTHNFRPNGNYTASDNFIFATYFLILFASSLIWVSFRKIRKDYTQVSEESRCTTGFLIHRHVFGNATIHVVNMTFATPFEVIQHQIFYK